MQSSITDKYNTDLSSHVNFFLQFYDQNLSQQYEKFNIAQSNKYAFLPLQLGFSFFYFFGYLNGLQTSFDLFHLFNLIFDLIFVLFLGNFLLVLYFKDVLFSKDSLYRRYLDVPSTARLESIWCMGNMFCLSLVTFSTGYHGECRNTEWGKNFTAIVLKGCNYSGISGQLPMDLVMTMYFAPIIFAVILKGANFFSIAFSMLLSTFMLILTMYTYDLNLSGPIVLLFCPICLVALYEFHRQDISLFLVTTSQAKLIEEVKRLTEETHAKELRCMIGNVAHDLKTVRYFTLFVLLFNILLALDCFC